MVTFAYPELSIWLKQKTDAENTCVVCIRRLFMSELLTNGIGRSMFQVLVKPCEESTLPQNAVLGL